MEKRNYEGVPDINTTSYLRMKVAGELPKDAKVYCFINGILVASGQAVEEAFEGLAKYRLENEISGPALVRTIGEENRVYLFRSPRRPRIK